MSQTLAQKPQNKRYLARKRANTRFKLYGLGAIMLALLILVVLLGAIFVRGWRGLQEAHLQVEISAISQQADLPTDWQATTREAVLADLPFITTATQRRELYALLSLGAPYEVKEQTQSDSTTMVKLSVSDAVNLFMKGDFTDETINQKLSPLQQRIIRHWQGHNQLSLGFDWGFFTNGDSREPELAGFLAAVIGSLLTILICLMLAFPLGVATAVYLEEFAPKNWVSDMIEVNINNLAAVPSIVFGLLGLALYLQFFDLPRSAALVGGLTLALLVLPVIIIATRAALRAVPPSIRDAARGLGASEVQVVGHHVLPLALPGIMTGTILAVARAIGETAPLLMIGMVAFIADVPALVTDPATAMPVQIYLWASSPEASFIDKTSAGIFVLLVVLLSLNLLAIWLRNKFEVKW